MLVIKSTERGYESNPKISLRLFEQSQNTVVKVVCETPYYGEPEHLENAICDYINNSMPNGYTVRTSHVTIESSTGRDTKGKYVDSLMFQIYI